MEKKLDENQSEFKVNSDGINTPEDLYEDLQGYVKLIQNIIDKYSMDNVKIDETVLLYKTIIEKVDVKGENNKIALVINKNNGVKNLRIDPQGENKNNFYYVAEKIADIEKELESAILFVKNGNLPENSSLTRRDIPRIEEYDVEAYLPDEVIEKTGFDQDIYDKILSEKGIEEAAIYGKNPKNHNK